MRKLILTIILTFPLLLTATDGPPAETAKKPPTHAEKLAKASIAYLRIRSISPDGMILAAPVSPREVLEAPNPAQLPWIKTEIVITGHPKAKTLADKDLLKILVFTDGSLHKFKNGRTVRKYQYLAPAP